MHINEILQYTLATKKQLMLANDSYVNVSKHIYDEVAITVIVGLLNLIF